MSWEDFTVIELKDELRTRGLSLGGRKADLIQRLSEQDLNPPKSLLKKSGKGRTPSKTARKSSPKLTKGASNKTPKKTISRRSSLRHTTKTTATKRSNSNLKKSSSTPKSAVKGRAAKAAAAAIAEAVEDGPRYSNTRSRRRLGSLSGPVFTEDMDLESVHKRPRRSNVGLVGIRDDDDESSESSSDADNTTTTTTTTTGKRKQPEEPEDDSDSVEYKRLREYFPDEESPNISRLHMSRLRFYPESLLQKYCQEENLTPTTRGINGYVKAILEYNECDPNDEFLLLKALEEYPLSSLKYYCKTHNYTMPPRSNKADYIEAIRTAHEDEDGDDADESSESPSASQPAQQEQPSYCVVC